MVLAYYMIIGVACIMAIRDFRQGIYVALVVDLLRDLVRKSSADESVLITLAGASVWGAVFVGVYFSNRNLAEEAYRVYPRMQKAVHLLLGAVIFGGLLSTVQYLGGYKLAIIGGVSYVMPLFGLAIGFAFPRDPSEIIKLMKFYAVLNGIFLIGVPLEYFGFDWNVLGGMKGVRWFRHQPGYIVDLMSGFYRSPDVMGLHAANTMMFCLSIAILPQPKNRFFWLLLACWSFTCLLLGGRRKMIGMPFVFLAVWLLIGHKLKIISRGISVITLGIAALVVATSLFVLSRYDKEANYSNYATTLVGESVGRTYSVIGTSLTTLRQSGVIGAGLGTATQGRYHANVRLNFRGGWQEDGLSRLLLEFGIIGVTLLAFALLHFLKSFETCFALTRGSPLVTNCQVVTLACVVANAASFVISHQQFSGDPGSAVIVLLLLGTVFGAYRMLGSFGANREPIPR